MSSQDEDGIPFEMAKDLQGLRLLELPPQLLELMRSSKRPRLALKAGAKPKDGAQQDTDHAVLCTDTQTFQIRQVQSSNSVYITQAAQSPLPADGIDALLPSLRAIARCPYTLELLPTKPESVQYLKQNTPVYKAEQIDHIDNNGLGSFEEKNKHQLLEDAPFSSGEFRDAWTEICAFEDGGTSFIPSAVLLVKVWESIMVAATIRGLHLHETFLIAAITADDNGFPQSLVEAILARISASNEELMEGYARLDCTKCISWVGLRFLESLGAEIRSRDFLRQWQDKLPEVWRAQATLDRLKGTFRQTNDVAIIYDDRPIEEKAAVSGDPKASTARAKPNWHERFKNTKK